MNIFIIFFIFLYLVLESIKYSNNDIISALRRKPKKLRFSVCMIKFIVLIIIMVLILVNRLLPSGMLERSTGISGFITIIFVFGIFFVLSVYDIKKAKKERGDFIEED